MNGPAWFALSSTQYQAMLSHVLDCLPEEGCGLVGGVWETEGVVAREVLPVENALHSPVRFRMTPEDQLKAFYWLEENELELVAIYHSHPTGPQHPSPTDLAEFAYPGTLVLIWSPGHAGWHLRGYRMELINGQAKSSIEVPIHIRDAEDRNSGREAGL
jgi:proteasome lid subunit RPN8/RPN11